MVKRNDGDGDSKDEDREGKQEKADEEDEEDYGKNIDYGAHGVPPANCGAGTAACISRGNEYPH